MIWSTDWLIDWLITCWFRALQPCTYAFINGSFVPHYNLWEPFHFAKVPDGPQTYILNIPSSRKEPTYAWLSKAKASYWQRIWAEVSSSAPHLLHSGLSISPIKWRCLLRVLCTVRRPVITLDCILLKDKSLALVTRHGPEINSRACFYMKHATIIWSQHKEQEEFRGSGVGSETAECIDWNTNSFGKANMESCAWEE
jgi:hypothetical protein